MDEVLETTDLTVAEHLLRDSYSSGMRLDPRGPQGKIRITQRPLTPQVRFDDLHFELTFDERSDPLGVLLITSVRAGQATYRSGHAERTYRSGDLGLVVQPNHGYTGRSAALDTEAAVIRPALLSQVAATLPGRAQQPVRLTGYHPLSAHAAGQWKNAFAFIRDTVLTQPEAAGKPLLAAGAARFLAAMTLAAFPSNALADPMSEDRRDAHPATLRRAVAFIDEHAHEDISAADIGAAAFVSIRAVQLAFQRHLDTTPAAYLRRVRLDRAHHELTSADPARETVTAVSYRWGFSSPSRFSAYYRDAYGDTPRHTLQR